MGEKTANGLGGVKMDKRRQKKLTRVVHQTDYGLLCMRKDRSNLKLFTRMVN